MGTYNLTFFFHLLVLAVIFTETWTDSHNVGPTLVVFWFNCCISRKVHRLWLNFAESWFDSKNQTAVAYSKQESVLHVELSFSL